MRRPAAVAAITAVASVLVGLAVVVLASRGTPGDRTAAAWETGDGGRSALLVLLAIADTASLVLAVWALWPDGSGEPRPPQKVRLLPYLVLLAVVLVVSVFAPERATEQPAEDRTGPAGELGPAEAEQEDGDGMGFALRASPRASLVATAVGVALVFGLVTALRLRRAAVGEDDEDDDREDDGPASAPAFTPLADAVRLAIERSDVEAAIAHLETEPDPRRVVRLAYAMLDAHLAGTLAARPATATPHEWLRAIRHVHAHGGSAAGTELVDAATRLTAAYEQARFSVRPLTPRHRSDAIADTRTILQYETTTTPATTTATPR